MSEATELAEGSAALTTLGGGLAEAGASALGGSPEKLAELLLRSALSKWEDPQVRPQLLGVLRGATTTEEGAAVLRDFMTTQLFAQAGAALGEDALDINQVAELLKIPVININLASAQVWGSVLLRYVVKIEPIASVSEDELISLLAPTIQRYLAG